MQPEDLVSQSVHLKEEQLRKEEEKLKEMELRVQREIAERRQELVSPSDPCQPRGDLLDDVKLSRITDCVILYLLGC